MERDYYQSTLLAALSTLSPAQLRHVTASMSSLLHLHRRRLLTVLSSPTVFSVSLRHLTTLSLPQKSLLVARLLLSSLSLLPFSPPAPPPPLKLRHLDSALLLLLLAQVRPSSLIQTPLSRWRSVLSSYVHHATVATVSSIATTSVLIQYVEMIAACKRIVGVVGLSSCGGEAAASAAAVVELPSVEVGPGEEIKECVVCKEAMGVGRDVCKLPCGHLFHWMCILPWLENRNTCPCCRGRMPTDDVAAEIGRLWEAVERAGGGGKMVISSCLY